MKSNRIVQLIIVAAVIWFVVTKGLPWWKSHQGSSSSSAAGLNSTDTTCVSNAEAASESWGSGISRYANPPYDLNAWDGFRGDVERKIRAAESKCSCSSDSCTKVRQAMAELRGVIAESDSAIKGNGAPPSDMVQRQELIDNAINEARSAQRTGN